MHWSRFDDVLSQAGSLAGKVLVTCSLFGVFDRRGGPELAYRFIRRARSIVT